MGRKLISHPGQLWQSQRVTGLLTLGNWCCFGSGMWRLILGHRDLIWRDYTIYLLYSTKSVIHNIVCHKKIVLTKLLVNFHSRPISYPYLSNKDLFLPTLTDYLKINLLVCIYDMIILQSNGKIRVKFSLKCFHWL